MKIKYKTSKSNAYVVGNNGLVRIEEDLEEFNFDKTLILANSAIADSDIVVVTHGFSSGKILFQTSKISKKIKYYEIGNKMKEYFPSLNKVDLICCYNACMKDIKMQHIFITIPNGMQTTSIISVDEISIDPITKCINLLIGM